MLVRNRVRSLVAAGMVVSFNIHAQTEVTRTGCLAEKEKYFASALSASEFEDITLLETAHCDGLVYGANSIASRLRRANAILFGGVRSEISINYPFKEKDVVSYSFQIYIPRYTEFDSLNRWWILAQWHDQPNKDLGETWASFQALPPPISIFFERNGFDPMIGLMLGDGRKFGATPLTFDSWHQIKVRNAWSYSDDGRTDLFVNGSIVYTHSGRNMNNRYQHYLKLGQYRSKEISASSVVFYRRLKITKE